MQGYQNSADMGLAVTYGLWGPHQPGVSGENGFSNRHIAGVRYRSVQKSLGTAREVITEWSPEENFLVEFGP